MPSTARSRTSPLSSGNASARPCPYPRWVSGLGCSGRKTSSTTRRRLYAAPVATCTACVLRAQCTTARGGRRVERDLDEASLERVRAYHATEAYAKARRKRQVWVEPLFAKAKEWHGLRRFRLRGLEQVNGEALLMAAGQNLKRLLRRGGWGRRPFPTGAAGVVLPALPLLPALTP